MRGGVNNEPLLSPLKLSVTEDVLTAETVQTQPYGDELPLHRRN